MNKKQIVVQNDKLILDLATYAATKGNTLVPKSQEDALKQMERVQNRFVEYKHLLMTGETTYDVLEDDVLNKYGITQPLVEQKGEEMPKEFKELLKQLKKEYKQKPIIGFGSHTDHKQDI